ncbi:hypothetical protein SteCoe_5901 [Stentor coeruleus]|uniref:NAD(+) ADP-ribosyltransferase n=1 Tax=Stentor coeruleus TaxID=5963 RepID=A0A1R2CRC7_9CILI|nr:hypothetical protein SteCoe_5901 [Stentor coeruleus]
MVSKKQGNANKKSPPSPLTSSSTIPKYYQKRILKHKSSRYSLKIIKNENFFIVKSKYTDRTRTISNDKGKFECLVDAEKNLKKLVREKRRKGYKVTEKYEGGSESDKEMQEASDKSEEVYEEALIINTDDFDNENKNEKNLKKHKEREANKKEKNKKKKHPIENLDLSVEKNQKKSPDDLKREKAQKNNLKSMWGFLLDKKLIKSYLQDKGYNISMKSLKKISFDDIEEGHKILKIIEKVFLYAEDKSIKDLSKNFYNLFPHFLQNLKVYEIDSSDKLKSKEDLLLEIEYFKFLYSPSIIDCPIFNEVMPGENLYESIYRSISASLSIAPISKNVILDHVFEIPDSVNKSICCNKALLWSKHSKHTIPRILKKGFIMPGDESPSLPYTYGKGIYCYDSLVPILPDSGRMVFILCDVALGKAYESFTQDFMFQKGNYDSVKGIGMIQPNTFVTARDRRFPVTFKINTFIHFVYNIYGVFSREQITPVALVEVKIT